MADRIPHLTALRAFEAAARHLSFQEAAEELGLSPSAVSHQIRSLESYLDVRLFERLTRAIALTESGHALRPGVEDGFRSIESAVRQVRSLKTGSILVVSTGPALAAKWLVPRLYSFEEQYPGIDLRITTSNKAIDLHRENIDVAIRHGRGNYSGLDSSRLFGEAYTPLCAPGLIRKKPGLKKPSDLASHRLLHDDSIQLPGRAPVWSDWLAQARVASVDGRKGQHFQQSDHAIQATIDGAGVLFGRVAVSAPDMAAGRLVQPFDLVLPSDYAFYFVVREGRRKEKHIAAFLDWLKSEAASMPFLPA